MTLCLRAAAVQIAGDARVAGGRVARRPRVDVPAAGARGLEAGEEAADDRRREATALLPPPTAGAGAACEERLKRHAGHAVRR